MEQLPYSTLFPGEVAPDSATGTALYVWVQGNAAAGGERHGAEQ